MAARAISLLPTARPTTAECNDDTELCTARFRDLEALVRRTVRCAVCRDLRADAGDPAVHRHPPVDDAQRPVRNQGIRRPGKLLAAVRRSGVPAGGVEHVLLRAAYCSGIDRDRLGPGPGAQPPVTLGGCAARDVLRLDRAV